MQQSAVYSKPTLSVVTILLLHYSGTKAVQPQGLTPSYLSVLDTQTTTITCAGLDNAIYTRLTLSYTTKLLKLCLITNLRFCLFVCFPSTFEKSKCFLRCEMTLKQLAQVSRQDCKTKVLLQNEVCFFCNLQYPISCLGTS